MPCKLIFLYLHLKFLTETSSFLVSTFSTVNVMHVMETKPASTHVRENAQRNYSQDSPTKPLQICRMIVPIWFTHMPITEHG